MGETNIFGTGLFKYDVSHVDMTEYVVYYVEMCQCNILLIQAVTF